MRRLLTLLFVLAFAAWAGINIAKDPGYMLLAWHHWTLETPLWFGIILWLIFAFLVILFANLWRSIESIATRWHSWRNRQKLTRSNNLTIRSLLECLEGYYASAEKNILKALPNAELPMVDYLIAAYCANQRGEAALRDDYLLNAKNLMPEAETGVQLLKVQWLLNANDLPQAQRELEILLHEDPYQARALLLAKDIYVQTAAWDDLLKVTQLLKKRKIIDADTYEDLQAKAYGAKLMEAAKTLHVKTLSACWITIPSQYQALPELALVYARALIKLNQGALAEEVLREALKKYWDDTLVICYGLAETNNTENQLKQAEKWLNDHENDADLLLTLGRLCSRAKLWEKARSYLEASLAMAPTAETYLALAELARAQENSVKAMEFYAKGLELSLRKE